MNEPAKQANPIDVDAIEKNEQRYLRFWSLLGLTLFISTWRLWTPQTDFPQIPFFEFLTAAPGTIDWICVGLLMGSLVGVFLMRSSRSYRACLWVFVLAAIILLMLNQHRLQPWIYQYIVFAIVIALLPIQFAFLLMRWVTVSIYLYSAVSKFDYQFIQTQGRAFVETLFGFAGISLDGWDPQIVSVMVLFLPAFELLMALGLIVSRTRILALLGIVVMHLLLILILGPFGLDHQPGVLVWNLFLLGNAVFLFGILPSSKPQDSNQSLETRPSPQRRLAAVGLTMLVILFPATVSLGYCDHWPGWEVYAPRCSRAQLVCSSEDEFPVDLREFAKREGDRVLLDLESWSLIKLGVPIYPEDRFQFAVAASVVENETLRWFEISIGGISDRWSGEREWLRTNRNDELPMWRERFRFNTQPRRR